jgi:hypothetical protein
MRFSLEIRRSIRGMIRRYYKDAVAGDSMVVWAPTLLILIAYNKFIFKLSKEKPVIILMA